MVKRNGDCLSEPLVVDEFDRLPVLTSPRPSPRPLLKRKGAQYFDDKSTSHASSSTSSTSTPGASEDVTVVHVRDENDTGDEHDRRCLLRELGVPESFPISLAMSIPLEYFWNDQHPSECCCHWCNVLFGSDRVLLFD